MPNSLAPDDGGVLAAAHDVVEAMDLRMTGTVFEAGMGPEEAGRLH